LILHSLTFLSLKTYLFHKAFHQDSLFCFKSFKKQLKTIVLVVVVVAGVVLMLFVVY